jgi:ribose transport system substrate-binding protein
MTQPATKRSITGALLVVLALAVAACGDNSSSIAAGDGAKAGQADARIDPLFKGTGYEQPPAAADPVRPQAGKKVWIISCNQSIPPCSVPAKAALEAADAVGWQTTLFDAKFEPARMAQGLQQAAAAGADGVITWGLDCSLIQAPLSNAERAGVRVVAGEALSNCSGGVGFDSVVSYTQGTFEKWITAYGAAQADLVAARTDGDAKVLLLDESDVPAFETENRAFEARLAEACSGCEVVERIKFTDADLGTNLEQKTQQALVSHPEANALYIPGDILSFGPLAALRASGRAKSVFIAVAEAQAPTIEALHQGAIVGAGVGQAQQWESYQEVDDLIRLFANRKPLGSGIGLQAFDLDHNLPPTGRWEPPVDFRAAYAKAWGTDASQP